MSSAAPEHLKDFFDPELGQMKNVLIRAGAGAGKTRELVRRVISLALVHGPTAGAAWSERKWPRLVVTTFTRKATQELRERLLKAGLAMNHPELLQYLQSSQSLHISTIHGILSVFLKRYGSAVDLAPDFQVIDGGKAARLSRRALRSLLKESEEFRQDFQELSEQVGLHELTEAASQWWSVQLETPEATRLTSEQLRADREEQLRNLVQGARHLCAQLDGCTLTESWQKWHAAFGALSAPDGLARFGELSTGLRLAKTKDVGEELKDEADRLRELARDLSGFSSTDEFFALHEELSERFERFARTWGERIRQEKLKLSWLTMEDLELFSLWLCEASPESAKAFAAEWDYWLIDEYQDTSPRQVQLIRSLTQGRSRFLVGDPQQSIYLFRGARSEVFAQAENEVKAMGGECKALMKNYRTSGPVLEFMNTLFEKASSQLKAMQVGRDSEVLPHPQVTLWQLPKEGKAEGLQVQAVLERITELMRAGHSPETICVLARKRADLAEIARLAQNLGVPCQLHAAGEFFERPEVRDALAFLRFLVTPEDNENLVALLRSPWLPAEDVDILRICESKERSFWTKLRGLTLDPALGPAAVLLTEALARTQTEGVARTWRDLLVKRGVFDYAIRLDPSGRREANLWKLVQNLMTQERQPGFRYGDFLEQPEKAETEEAGGGDASPVSEPKRVQLMTVHASKGLQFGHVIVPFLDDDRVMSDRPFWIWNEEEKFWSIALPDPEEQKRTPSRPGLRGLEKQKSRSEEELDRLFYVAVTRAQSSLTLLWEEPPAKTEKKIWARTLQALSRADGDVSWSLEFREHRPDPARIHVPAAEISVVRAPWAATHSPAAIRQAISVTALLSEEERARTSKKAGAQTWEKVRRSVRGTEVHRLLESLKYDPERKLATPEWAEVLEFLDSPKGEFLPPLISSGEVEWGFAVRLGQHLVQGQIDLWGRDADGTLWIVDYKTGSPDKSEMALKQLDYYGWALAKLGHREREDRVRLAAVFPFHDEVIEREARSVEAIEAELTEGLKPPS